MTDDSAIAPEPTTIEVKDLGTLQGWKNRDGTTQFFGVTYAEYPERWTHSKLKDTWEDGKMDARRLRGCAPQPPRGSYPFLLPDREHTGPSFASEFDCLNMQITLPRGTTPDSKLPIMMYIHGGAFVWGTANYRTLDGAYLANTSSDEGTPTIIVTINYRLGFCGYLASEDFDGANFGLGDQLNAIKWVNRYISSLGGNPDRLTVAGQSAGAASTDTLLRSSSNHLFSQIILLSGTAPICGLHTRAEYSVVYTKLLLHLGIPLSLPAAERLARARAVPFEAIAQANHHIWEGLQLPQIAMCTDSSVLGEGYETPGPDSSSEVVPFKGRMMIGDCKHEGIIYETAYDQHSAPYIISKIQQYFPAPFAAEIVDHYGLHEDMTLDELFDSTEPLMSDIMFCGPPYFMREANPEQTWAYYFDHGSRWDNKWIGRAHHSLDYMFLFGGLDVWQDEEEKALSKVIAKDYIAFVNGLAPYPAYGKQGNGRVYGPEASHSTINRKTYSNRAPAEWYEKLRPHMAAGFKFAADLNVNRPKLLSLEYGPGSKNAKVLPDLRSG